MFWIWNFGGCGLWLVLVILVDSLKSLPTGNEEEHRVDERIDHDLVRDAAEWLMRNLGLTIFGFDVVVSILRLRMCVLVKI